MCSFELLQVNSFKSYQRQQTGEGNLVILRTYLIWNILLIVSLSLKDGLSYTIDSSIKYFRMIKVEQKLKLRLSSS